MPRVRDWQSRLDGVITARRAMPFAWGPHDCVTFAAACVSTVTATDPLAGLPAWSTAAEAARVLHDGGGLRALAAARLGAEISPALAQPGDVGLFDEGGRDALCVRTGAAWVAPGADGLVRVQPSALVTAWRCC